MDGNEKPGFGLYVHWPFCAAKCPYCDFNSHVVSGWNTDDWAKAYLAQIDIYAAKTPGRRLTSIYFGGGTPSLMSPEIIDRVITKCSQTWGFSNDIEITLEANPSSVEISALQGFRLAGVSRVSIGVQALNDDDLRKLGRLHSTEDAMKAIDCARQTFDQFSFDLIYARQGQTLEDWKSELSQALSLAGNHLSLYQLTIEPETAFGKRFAAGNLKDLPNEDLSADMWDMTQDMTAAAGYTAYEISNHAKPDAESRHNLTYWRGEDYVGIGPGAHGRLTIDGTRYATVEPSNPSHWLKSVGKTGAVFDQPPLSLEDQLNERLMMGLRTSEGVLLSEIKALTDQFFISPHLLDMGFLHLSDNRLSTTERGRPVLNEILRQLLVT